jgi:adenosylmethionine-8-amino-7-oxononanoate aminotransferase
MPFPALAATRVLHRQLTHSLPMAVGARGIEVFDAEGRAYIDACGGAAVSCLGHGHPAVLAAMHRQIDALAYAHTSFFTSEPAEALAAHLVKHAPPGISHAYFVSGGSEAMEAALKMARQYCVETGQPQRTRFIARRQSYHGNTLGALAVGGNAWRRAQFAPLLIDVIHVSPCYAYRDQREGESAEQYGQRLVQELADTIDRVGGETVIAFVAETVGGATAGALTAVPGYLQGVRALCDRHGILLILDEVMCGMGRTGTLHACLGEEAGDGVVPDLLAIAKGLGGGYQPIGAVLAQRRIVEAFARGSGLFHHGHTYLGHPVACAAGLAVQQVIEREGLLQAVRRQGRGLAERLRAAFGEHPHVGDLRGRGLFIGVELVADRSRKTAFDPALRLHAAIKREAMARGLMVYPMGGTIDGRTGDHVLLAPPFIVTEDDLDRIVERLQAAVDAAIAAVGGTQAAPAS